MKTPFHRNSCEITASGLFLFVLSLCVTITAVAELKPEIIAPQGIGGRVIPITVRFKKDDALTPVTGFSIEDIQVINGRASDFSGSGHGYHFKVHTTTTPKNFTVSIRPDAGISSSFAILQAGDKDLPFFNWSKQMEISFPGYPADRPALSNFPVLVILNEGHGLSFSAFNPSEGISWSDLRFTSADKSNELKYEVESWDAKNGKAWVWVRLPELRHATKIYAFWGKAGESAPAYTQNGSVWSDTHVGVWHMNESAAPRDASGRGNHGETVGKGVQYAQAGKVAGGFQVTQSGGNGGVRVPDRDALDFGDRDFSIEMWIRKEAGSKAWKNIGDFSKWRTGAQPGQNEWSLGTTVTGDDNRPGFGLEIGQISHHATASENIVINTWNHLVGVRRGTVLRLYVNGVEHGAKTGVTGPVNNMGRDLYFGYFQHQPSLSTHATFDEIRISHTARSKHWIWATFMSGSSPEAFTGCRLPNPGGETSVAASENFSRHWAYDPPVRWDPPNVSRPDWGRQPLDDFVLAKMEAHGLQPSPPAEPAAWLRRVSLDLIGLPPSLEELDAFLKDESQAARARAVDRLLRSKHFGERWAQPWLDLARYGDSTGIHEDHVRPSWAWRDWVITALNEDMPFDRFTIEQLAGDLLPDATTAQRIATGFHRAAPFNSESGTPKEARRSAQVIDRVNVTATVWLGSTFECAQCHDHKFDPITQEDYYRFLAYFNNTPDESGKSIGAGRDAMAGPTVPVGGASTFVMQEMKQTRQTRIYERGDYEKPGKTVKLGLPAALHKAKGNLPANRLGLAQWLVDPKNPLTARVAVNRWWAELFGAGIVRTIDDFGKQGEPPTHPGLLDWLAVEFVDNGWSMKRLLRKIVLSSTYGQSSRIRPETRKRDPENRWLSHAPRLRLSAEAIRDNALSIAGLLSPTIGGAPAYPPQPDNIWWIRDDKSPKYQESQGEQRYRRGLYTIWRRTYLHPSLAVFDAPDRVTCAFDRGRSNTPLQALTLLNDPIYLETAFHLARKLSEQRDRSEEERISHAFRKATARQPDPSEIQTLKTLLQSRLARFESNAKSAELLVDSVRGELLADGSPTNPEAMADLAAWFHVASVILNLDETITKE